MNKTQKLWTTIALLCWGAIAAIAGPIDKNEALKIAKDFLYKKTSRTTESVNLALSFSNSNTYLFESETDFALVAADDALPQILGYGEKNGNVPPPALKEYLNAAKYGTTFAQEQTFTPVKALLPFVRHQNAPYNNECPFYITSKGEVTKYRCVVGCVATALEEIISYYRRDVVLQDTLHGWESKKHTNIEDVLPGTTVNCRLIRNNYDSDDYTTEEADAVARLSYYCGVAAKMNWGIEESGASIQNVIAPLKRAFGYGYVQYVDSYKYSPSDWLKMIREEIYAKRPILYTAFLMRMGGHAFVVDGLDEKGLFHVNWGYGGSYDGYFRLDVLNYCEPPAHETPDGKEAGFFTNHQALFLHPDAVEHQLPDTLARTGYEIAIDSVTLELAAETQKETPLSVYIRNTTAQYLTTPFEFFTNNPKDTAILEQGDFVALGASILAPYETRKIKIHANFEQAGERILRISPDDKAILYERPISISKGKAAQLTFEEPQLSFPTTNEVFITQTVFNADTAGRCGQEILYELGPGDASTMKDGIRHSRHLYIQPGEIFNDTIRYHSLVPGQTYTLLVRSPWKVKTQKTFVMPDLSGITSPSVPPIPAIIEWYTLDGRRVHSPQQTGVYLRKEGNQIQKIYIKTNNVDYEQY